MRKLNNKGFAIESVIICGVLVFMLCSIVSIITFGSFSFNRNNTDNIQEKIFFNELVDQYNNCTDKEAFLNDTFSLNLSSGLNNYMCSAETNTFKITKIGEGVVLTITFDESNKIVSYKYGE